MGSYKRKRSRKALTLDEAKLRMTDGIKALERVILESDDEYKVIQATNAMSGLVSRYSKLLEVDDLEKRIKKLEEKFELRKVS
jgi:uncharacterized protein YjaG (DUF416 family)